MYYKTFYTYRDVDPQCFTCLGLAAMAVMTASDSSFFPFGLLCRLEKCTLSRRWPSLGIRARCLVLLVSRSLLWQGRIWK